MRLQDGMHLVLDPGPMHFGRQPRYIEDGYGLVVPDPVSDKSVEIVLDLAV